MLAGVGPILWGSPLPPTGTEASILEGTVPLECKGSGPDVSKFALLVSAGDPVLMLKAGEGEREAASSFVPGGASLLTLPLWEGFGDKQIITPLCAPGFL